MTAQNQYDRPGTQRTDHLSQQRAAASRSRCSGCPHKTASGSPEAAKCLPAASWQGVESSGQTDRLSQQMWQVYTEIEAQASNLDSALRRTWLWLGGVLLPFAGIIVYAMAHAR
jgi:hypothetical protein